METNHKCGTCNTGPYGHVGIITSADSVGFNAVNQNFNGQSKCTQNWFRISALACGIRPVFSSQEANLSYEDVKTTFVDSWNAGLYGKINNPERVVVSHVGAYIWNAGGALLVNHQEICGRNTSVVYQNLNIVGEARPQGLSAGTYTYQLWASANGKTYYSGKGNFTIKDTKPPVISNVKITDITSDGYTVQCTVLDDVNVNRVQFPTWTTANGQDDIFAEWWTNKKCAGINSGTTWSYRVNRTDHNNEYGAYVTHIYAYDDSGNYANVSTDSVILKKKQINGWIYENGNTYYYSSDRVVTGFRKINGKIYYFKTGGDAVEKGKMLKGWQKIYNRYFYFNESGSMYSGGWKNIGKKSYYFNLSLVLPAKNNQSGSVVTGFRKIGKYYYYFSPSGGKGTRGQLLTGIQKFKQGKRYFKTSGKTGVKGRMLVGKQKIKGVNHYFKKSGSNIGIMLY